MRIFGVSTTGEVIKEKIVEKASDSMFHKIHEEIKNAIYERNRYNDPRDYVTEKTTEFLEKHKDEIINKAAEMAADKLSRTKAAKEAAAKAICEKS